MPVKEEIEELEPNELNFDREIEDDVLKNKVKLIEEAYNSDENRIKCLKEFALSEGGLVNDEVRRKVWPALLGLDKEKADPCPDDAELESHLEYQQVVLDVKRSLKRFPPGIPYKQRVALQDQLTRLILRVIKKYPHLCYYQGYHDVAVTFLLVVGEDVAFQIMEHLSTNHLRECMEPTMDKTSYILNHIYPLIKRLHPVLHDFIEKSNVGTVFCLPWYLTWYGHSLNHYKDVVRLYDYFLASPPLLPLYLAAVIVVHRSEEILNEDCDMANVHCLLSQLPDDLPFEKLLAQASELYQNFPPESIEQEVKEKIERDLRLLQSEMNSHRRAAVRHDRRRYLWPMFWALPNWARQQNRFRILMLTATVAVGLYAYFRSEAPDFAFLSHSIR